MTFIFMGPTAVTGSGCRWLHSFARGEACSVVFPGWNRSRISPTTASATPNLPYRVICYTAAWIGILVPFILNLIGLGIAAVTGQWTLGNLYHAPVLPSCRAGHHRNGFQFDA